MRESVSENISVWLEAISLYVHENPEQVFEALLGTVALVCIFALALLRSQRKSARVIAALQKEISDLTVELSNLREAPKQELVEGAIIGQEVIPETPPPLPEKVLPVPAPAPIPEAPKVERVEPAARVTVPPGEVVAEKPEESVVSRGLQKSRTGLLSRLASLFSGKPSVDESQLDDLEEALILSDIGARVAADLVQEVRTAAHTEPTITSERLKDLLKEGIREKLIPVPADHRVYRPVGSPLVILVVGINGVGKTTTVAKLASKYKDQGKKVMVVAADTFRAAAVEQLAEWSRRVGFLLSRGAEGAKPGAVAFDGMVAAKNEQVDVVLIDTAGRLHTKSNLMQELEGVRNSIRKHFSDAPHETVLVVDGVSGQNALMQAREFNAAVPLTGLVVTKLDGTPKGGIIVAISQELNLPVFYIGVGEKVGDLVPFDRHEFAQALFEESALSPKTLGAGSFEKPRSLEEPGMSGSQAIND